MKSKPKTKCWLCRFRDNTARGDTYSKCTNKDAKATGIDICLALGYSKWPHSFHPTTIKNCNGFEEK